MSKTLIKPLLILIISCSMANIIAPPDLLWNRWFGANRNITEVPEEDALDFWRGWNRWRETAAPTSSLAGQIAQQATEHLIAKGRPTRVNLGRLSQSQHECCIMENGATPESPYFEIKGPESIPVFDSISNFMYYMTNEGIMSSVIKKGKECASKNPKEAVCIDLSYFLKNLDHINSPSRCEDIKQSGIRIFIADNTDATKESLECVTTLKKIFGDQIHWLRGPVDVCVKELLLEMKRSVKSVKQLRHRSIHGKFRA